MNIVYALSGHAQNSHTSFQRFLNGSAEVYWGLDWGDRPYRPTDIAVRAMTTPAATYISKCGIIATESKDNDMLTVCRG